MKKVTCHDIYGNLYEVDEKQLKFRPSVYGILIEDGKILLSKQHDGYDFPGGGVELGETLQKALQREFFEETGFKVEVGEPIYTKTAFFHPAHSAKHKDEFWNCPLLYFIVKRIGGGLTTEHFDEDEKKYADMAQWIVFSELDGLKCVNAVEWDEVLCEFL
jgi:8-oxo-dGTP diphosphatase